MNDWFEAEQHVERAHEFYEASRWDDAERELREALSLNPGRAEWHFNLGLTLEAAGRRREAIDAYLDAHRLEPDEPQTALALGASYLRLEDAGEDDLNEAVRWLEEARGSSAQQTEAQIHLVEACARLGRHEDAEVAYYMALQDEGADQALAHVNMADSLSDRGLHAKALWCLREAAQTDPQMPGVHARLGSTYAALGRRDQARQLFLRELRNNPGDIDTLLDLGCLLVEMNRPGEAREKFRRVIELEPDSAEAHFELARLAMRQRRDDQAITILTLVLRLNQDFPGARRLLAEAHLRRGEDREARRLLRRDYNAFQRDPERFDEAALEDLGRLLLDARLPVRAFRIFNDLTRRRPDDAMAHHHRSVALLELGRRQEGARAARRALRLKPGFVPAMHNVALALLEEGRYARASVWVSRARAIDQDDPSLRRLQARLRLWDLSRRLAGLRRRLRAGARRMAGRRG